MTTLPGYVKFRVDLKQIAAVYDVLPDRTVTGPPDDPRLVFRTPEGLGDGLPYRPPKYVDQLGEPVSYVREELPGVYRSLHATHYGQFEQTFSRRQSIDLHEKYVYVFKAYSKSGHAIELLHELQFQNGEFAYVDLTQHQGQDVRPHGEKRHKSLFVDILEMGSEIGPHYFFFLSPMQMPWAALEDLKSSVVSRGSRLGDEYWTDAYPLGEPQSPRTLWEIQNEGLTRQPVGFTVHLLEPAGEALRRHERFVELLDLWIQEQETLAEDSEYVLAKRIDGLARPDERLFDHVVNKIGTYLVEQEEKSVRLRTAMEVAAQDLTRWIGVETERTKWGRPGSIFSHIWFSNGTRRFASTRDEDPIPASSPFSDLMRDFHEHGSDEAWGVFGEIVAMTQDRLSESVAGLSWMRWVFDQYEEGRPIRSDGGARFLFEAGRRTHGAWLRIMGMLLRHYAPLWSVKHAAGAADNVVRWMKTIHGIDLEKIENRRKRKKHSLEGRREIKRARKSGFQKIQVTTEQEAKFRKTQTGFRFLQLAIELINFSLTVDRLRRSKDPWELVDLGAALVATASTIGDLVAHLPENYTVKIPGTSFLSKAAGPLAILCNVIVAVMAGRAAWNAPNFGQSVGHGMRMVGGAMAAGGTAFAKTGVGAVVAIAGFVMQALGSWVVANFSSLGLFLQYCRWGESGLLTDAVTAISDKNSFGYGGDLSDLKDDIPAQHRALDELFFGFKPELELKRHGRHSRYGAPNCPVPVDVTAYVTVKAGIPPALVGPDAKWTIEAEVVRRDLGNRTIKEFSFEPNVELDHTDVALNEEVMVCTFLSSHDDEAKSIEKAEGTIVVSGRMTLDILGDGSRVVTRPIEEESFWLTLINPSVEETEQRPTGS